ncbi:MAG: hypothetical protein ACHQ52_14965 [Candidatus Eisenbacteria bacterium]
MSGAHLSVPEIAELLRRPADDPRRRHVEGCVRCRMLMSRYQAFLARPEHLPGGEIERAESRLQDFLDREIVPAPATARRVPATRSGWLERWFGSGSSPAWRPAFAALALVVIATGAWWIVARRTPQETRAAATLRGGGASGGGGRSLRAALPTESEGGVLVFHWEAVVGADRYELRFFTPELAPVGDPMPVSDTTLTLAPHALTGAARGDTLLWRVAARHGEAVLAESRPRIVVLP